MTVSVTTIKGTECRLLELGRVADITGGQVSVFSGHEFSYIDSIYVCPKVDMVDPLKIADEFSNILATPVIATNVGAKIVMHRDL